MKTCEVCGNSYDKPFSICARHSGEQQLRDRA